MSTMPILTGGTIITHPGPRSEGIPGDSKATHYTTDIDPDSMEQIKARVSKRGKQTWNREVSKCVHPLSIKSKEMGVMDFLYFTRVINVRSCNMRQLQRLNCWAGGFSFMPSKWIEDNLNYTPLIDCLMTQHNPKQDDPLEDAQVLPK